MHEVTTVRVVTARKSLDRAECPVSRSIEQIGEWWSILILRDAITGITRFDDFRRHLRIGPSMLTRRLRKLVAEGLLERRRYHDHPERYEYVLTRRGEQFSAVVLALAGWWNDAVEPQCRSIVVVDAETGAEVEPVVVDARTGARLAWPRHVFAAGPGASPQARARLPAVVT